MAVEYFTKWVEAEAVSAITESRVRTFIWKNIICRFGLPRVLVSDNGAQFSGSRLKEWLQSFKVEQRFTSVGHPQANGQVEATNKTIVKILEKRLRTSQDNWADDLDAVLWAHRTTAQTATQETPFSLVYGSEAVIPSETVVATQRIQQYNPDGNEVARVYDLELLEDKRDKALANILRYQAMTARAYNKRVFPKDIQVGDLVLRRADILSHVGKLKPNWEGPYKVTGARVNGSFELEDEQGRALKRTWNAKNLRKFYT